MAGFDKFLRDERRGQLLAECAGGWVKLYRPTSPDHASDIIGKYMLVTDMSCDDGNLIELPDLRRFLTEALAALPEESK